MKSHFTAIFLSVLLSLGTISAAWSADLEKGLTAAKSGDYATALQEWTPLAKQGNASAQYNLGQMYRDGEGVPKNDKTAVKWYALAAEQGVADAQYSLGQMYANGDGVPENDTEAVKWGGGSWSKNLTI